MDYLIIVFRTLIFYFIVLIYYRIMGKREVGQLGIIDLIVSILIAELVAISIENFDSSMLNSILPITVLVGLQILLSTVGLKFPKARNFLDGKPSVIIENGKINFKEMSKQKYNLDDLLMQLREQGIKSLEQIDYAILEVNGKLSIFKKNLFDKNFPFPIVLDGEIQQETLFAISKSESWLENALEKKNIDLENVFYAFYKGYKLFIIKRDK